ncbi:PAS domain-containing sensor histidine kinase [Bdellovibrio bacteriovorus]|uniref:histidine kinase n=1 Tax=Bdellovibrio bacteriovorus TaxID=959 RepID=A0A150WM16_BDEBC|nr:ATP-binding protein [Bdellovibrio bacteriovorus]KYG64946.1 PAS domain-containing sensor histidine kinase [Bdellovibrio bacteriovorus]
MRLSLSFQQNKSQGLIVEFARVSLFALILLISVASSLFQEGFVNWSILGPFYGILTIAFSLHVLYFAFWDKLLTKPALLFAGFVIDSFLISVLIFYSGINQSLFLFLHLVNILLAGIACRSVGAVTAALFTSIFFSGAALFSPEMKALNFFFLLALNNIAFFSVAGLSGYLSEQLQTVGTELKKTGQSLRSAQELNEVLVENIPGGMISFTPAGELVRANAMAAGLLGVENILDRTWTELFPNLSSMGSFRGDVKYQPADGDEKVLGMTLSQVYSPELQAQLNIALFEDLTKIRQLEYAARQNEKLAAIGGLAAGIAHEIRNPLAGISGSIEMLSQTVSNDDDKKLMKIILREIDRLNNLITEFLDYSRPEVPPTDRVDLSSLLNEVLESMKTNNQVRADVNQVREFSGSLMILGRRDKLKQAFLNIILNSYQAMADSASAQITVKALNHDKEIELRIRDTGSGMKETTRRKMFEPFHTTKPKGTGLGLAVTHKILEGHGAKVFVESEVGVGTEFILTFPKAH